MSVTLFVEVEVKRAWGKREFQVVAEAVGMWEARGFCELPKAYCRHFHSHSRLLIRHRLQHELMTIEPRQGEGGKINVPVAIVGRLHTDKFSPQTLADKDLCAFPEESSIRIHSLRLHAGVVFRFRNSIRIEARRTVVARGRRLLLQRLMRAFLVELSAEP